MRRWDMPPPDCPVCLGPRTELASRFGVIFTGPITARYNDPKRENAHMDGFWAYRKRTSLSGQPEPVFLSTFDEMRAFNKAEGLASPGEVPTNSTITADGRRIVSDGMPGQWRGSMPEVPSRIWEMNSSLTSLAGKAPAPIASGPPCTAAVADASLMEKFTAEARGE